MTNLENLTKEEYEVAVKAIEELRREREAQLVHDKVECILYAGVATAIEYIGLANTKTIIREINRKLRELNEGEELTP